MTRSTLTPSPRTTSPLTRVILSRVGLTSIVLLIATVSAPLYGQDRLGGRGSRRQKSSQSSSWSGWSNAMQQGMQQGLQQGIASRMSQPQESFGSFPSRQQTMVVAQAPRPQYAQPEQSVLVTSQAPPGPQPTAATHEAAPAEMTVRQAPVRPLPVFATGSELLLEDQAFGDSSGEVRLQLGPLSIPVEIKNWSATEVSIKLPSLDLTSPADAEMIVENSQGELVAKSKIRLVASQGRLAMEN
jgi:hypothetical protein